MDRKKHNSRRDFFRTGIPRFPNSQQEPAPEKPVVDSQQRLQAEYLQSFSKSAMACQFEVFFNLNQYEVATEATLAAFELIDVLEDQLSVYREASEVSELNRSAGVSFGASDLLRDILEQAELLHSSTGGAFDITSTPLSRAWGFQQRQGSIPSEQAIEEALACVDAGKISLTADGVKLGSDTEINLNSIGKGYALDQAAMTIRGFGAHDFVIHGGQSSVMARGNESKVNISSEQDNGWTVGLSHPFVPNHRLGEIVLRNQALGTSGTARQGFYHQGRRYGHVIDPRTGWPTDHFLSATVVSQSAATSDALATAFFVMSLEEVQAFCDQHRDVAAVLVLAESSSGPVSVETFNASEDLVQLS
jgi:thiamine biosynthesis lipoprotein